jgi:exonuclease SbcC
VDELLEQHELALGRIVDLLEQVDALATAERGLADLERRTATLALEHGFGSSDEARTALLEDALAEELETEQRERESRRHAALLVLEELGDAGVGSGDDSLDELQLQCEQAARLVEARVAEVATTRDTADALERLAVDLDAALTAWEPARAAHATADGISRLVRGTGKDNQLQMRLSSYVLATRLDQVLDAANERLGDMRDQRYTLRRCGDVRGSSRAGLGLEVLDSWTGEARSPMTLSGGETFVVSLALALGLADVVGHETGGRLVETLFVDEGFGMLDPETLDDVMDRIDALRAGGRTVGVVSHVPELRGRIPTQVQVQRGRAGSTIEVCGQGSTLVA